MLVRSSAMPTRAGYAFEPKLDGFRCLIRTERGFEVRSRRLWNMTPLVPELEAIPARGIFDGELIAFADGQPDFVALCDRMLLTKDPSIPIAFVAFDVLSLDGTNTMREPYRKRRELLEDLELAGPHWSFTPSFSDGEALWQVVEEQELEGLVAKPLGSLYKAGERGWLKVKNKAAACYVATQMDTTSASTGSSRVSSLAPRSRTTFLSMRRGRSVARTRTERSFRPGLRQHRSRLSSSRQRPFARTER
jgi:bifunctional non-homologous end joining protein LigD